MKIVALSYLLGTFSKMDHFLPFQAQIIKDNPYNYKIKKTQTSAKLDKFYGNSKQKTIKKVKLTSPCNRVNEAFN